MSAGDEAVVVVAAVVVVVAAVVAIVSFLSHRREPSLLEGLVLSALWINKVTSATHVSRDSLAEGSCLATVVLEREYFVAHWFQ